MYTYDGIAGATAPGWKNASDFCKANGLVWAPSVAPGYLDDRAVPGNTTPTVDRDNGATYDRQWNNALAPATGGAPTWVSVTSFNEWHEGSILEPARSNPPGRARLPDLRGRVRQDRRRRGDRLPGPDPLLGRPVHRRRRAGEPGPGAWQDDHGEQHAAGLPGVRRERRKPVQLLGKREPRVPAVAHRGSRVRAGREQARAVAARLRGARARRPSRCGRARTARPTPRSRPPRGTASTPPRTTPSRSRHRGLAPVRATGAHRRTPAGPRASSPRSRLIAPS